MWMKQETEIVKLGARKGLVWLFGGIIGCSPAAPAEVPAGVVPVASPSGAACAQGASPDRCAPEVASVPVSCVEGTTGAGCAGIVGDAEEKTLTASVDAARDSMMKSQFRDVHAMVELSRLLLRRDAEVADAEGANDATRALKNAMRAVAVDDAALAPRIALTMARARLLLGSKVLSEPGTRGQALSLLEISLQSAPASGPGAGAAAMAVLRGYVALEKGDRAGAKASFQAATELDPALGSGWMGLGDAARSGGAFDAAQAAYKTAAARLPDDVTVKRALESAARREVLPLPSVKSVGVPIERGPVAPAGPAVAECAPSVAATPANAKLCAGLSDLAKAKTPDEHAAAGRAIIDGWNDVRPLCDAKDPACGAHVAPALAAASRAFQTGGQYSKAIAVGAMVLGRPDLPGAAAILPVIALENGDRYFALGIYDTAADYYERSLSFTGSRKGPVARRALALRIALGGTDAAQKLASGIAVDTGSPALPRAAAVLATAALVRVTRGQEQAASWMAPYASLIKEAGISEAGPSTGSKEAEAPAGCASLLACAVRRLAGEARWTQ